MLSVKKALHSDKSFTYLRSLFLILFVLFIQFSRNTLEKIFVSWLLQFTCNAREYEEARMVESLKWSSCSSLVFSSFQSTYRLPRPFFPTCFFLNVFSHGRVVCTYVSTVHHPKEGVNGTLFSQIDGLISFNVVGTTYFQSNLVDLHTY